MIKVYAAEMLDYVVDEGVQIHGGYGYHQDYAVERAYRDSRINRLFEGTSEINRLVITGMPLKRAARGQLPLLRGRPRHRARRPSRNPAANPPMRRLNLVHNAKRIALLTLGVGAPEVWREARTTAGDHHEHVRHHHGSVCDGVESAAQPETGGGRGGVNAADACAVYLRDAIARIELSSRTVLSACDQGEELRRNLSRLRGYASHDPVNAIALRRQIAGRLLASERYTV